MYIKITGVALALSLAGAPALAQMAPPPPPPEAKTSAQPYVMASGQSDLFEINSSQIALDKSQNAGVRKYAQMMIKHHTKTTALTMKAAQKAGLSPTPPMLDPGATASINELQTAAPGDFDRIYLGQQIPSHQAALDLQQSYAKMGDKAPLKANARAATPIVKQHLAAATKMQNGMSMGEHKGM